MRVALLHTRRGYLNEPGLGPQLVERLAAAVTHAGPHSAHKLIHKRSKRALERHSPLHTLWYELPIARLHGHAAACASLLVSVSASGHHRAERTHSAVLLERPPAIE